MVRDLGADEVIDYTKEDLAGRGERCDSILDAVDKASKSQCRKALGPHGTCLNAGMKRRDVADDLAFLGERVEAGELRSVIDRCYPMAEVAEAYRYVEKGHKRGNVVMTVAHDGEGQATYRDPEENDGRADRR